MASLILKKRTKVYTANGNEFLYNRRPDNSEENTKVIHNYFKNRILQNEEIVSAEPGLYTWILKTSGNFYAAKTVTKQEVGTLHINLKMLTDTEDDTPIYAAGELEISQENNSGNMIIFNLLSGTYMASKFKKLSTANKFLLRNEIVDTMIKLFTGLGIFAQFLECSAISCSEEEKIGGMMLIEPAHIRTESTNLEALNKMFVRKYGGTTKRSNKQKRNKKITQTHKVRK